MAVSVVQTKATGSTGASTSYSLTFTSTATIGNILVTAISIDKDGGTVSAPAGWTLGAQVKASTSSTLAWAWKVSTGLETSLNWTWTTSRTKSAWFGEFSGLTGVIETASNANSNATAATSQTSGTTDFTTVPNTYAIAMYSSDTGSNVETGRQYSRGFSENTFIIFGSSPGTCVALNNIYQKQAVETTFTTTDTGDQQCGSVAVFRTLESNVIPFKRIIPVDDATAPVLSSPTGTKTGSSTADGSVSTDEGNGTLYYYASTNVSETAATIKVSGDNQAVSATGTQNVSFIGLSPSTTYYAHYVQDDAATNESNVQSSTSFTTDASGVTIPVLAYHYNHNAGSNL